jgi:peptide subunit release factor 1 (eRF1)
MFTEGDLRDLLGYKANHPVLSVYLNTDPAGGSADVYKLRLRSMLKEIDLPEDEQAILLYFDHQHDWTGRSVAVFSCQPESFIRVYPFAVPLRDRLRVSERPYVKPLADLMDSYGGYGIALVDKQGARLFYYHLGEIREQEGVLGETVRRTKRGGSSQAPGRRGGVAGRTNYVEELTERNMREAADFAARFFTENNVRRVLIGGTDENVNAFRGHLPKSWQSLVVGTFPISMQASSLEVMERASEVGTQAERDRESRLLQSLVTSSAKGRGGVLDLEDTLDAVRGGRVMTLIIQEGYRAPGYRCQGCGYLTPNALEACPFCGKSFDQISDAVELAVWQVMQDGGEVEVLHDSGDQKEFHGIGALLRY